MVVGYIGIRIFCIWEEDMKVGIFHWSYDNIVGHGGGEVLIDNVSKALGSPVNCIVRNKQNKLGFVDITDKIPTTAKLFRGMRIMDYLSWSSIDPVDFGDFDVILTSGMTTRAMIVPENVPHINLCLSPPRWLYDLWHRRRNATFFNGLLTPFGEAMRIWDNAVDNRVDYYIAISEVVKRRLWHYLKRDSDVIYPPIDISRYKNKNPEGYFLFLSRLETEKRPEETIQACINTNQNLIVAGTGTFEKILRKKYSGYNNIIFEGFVSDKRKTDLLSHCEALIFTSIAEDFGIVPIEALASGKPIICSDDGFPPLLTQNEKFGIITNGTVRGIEIGINHYLKNRLFSPEELMEHAKRFDFSVFKRKINEKLKFYKEDFDAKLFKTDN